MSSPRCSEAKPGVKPTPIAEPQRGSPMLDDPKLCLIKECDFTCSVCTIPLPET